MGLSPITRLTLILDRKRSLKALTNIIFKNHLFSFLRVAAVFLTVAELCSLSADLFLFK